MLVHLVVTCFAGPCAGCGWRVHREDEPVFATRHVWRRHAAGQLQRDGEFLLTQRQCRMLWFLVCRCVVLSSSGREPIASRYGCCPCLLMIVYFFPLYREACECDQHRGSHSPPETIAQEVLPAPCSGSFPAFVCNVDELLISPWALHAQWAL